MIQSFKKKCRPNGWEPTYDFQIGAHLWAWVLSEELKCALHGWLGQGPKGVKRGHDEVEDGVEPDSQIQSNVDDEVEDGVEPDSQIQSNVDDEVEDGVEPDSQIPLNVDDEDEDGVRISNAICAQGDNLTTEEALERSHVQYNSLFLLQAPEQNYSI